MKIAYSYRYGRFSKGIVFFLMTIWTLLIGFLPMILMKKGIIPSAGIDHMIRMFLVIFAVWASIIALIFFFFGIYRVKGSSKAKHIKEFGKPGVGAIGSLHSKTVYYQGVVTTKKVVFFYKGEDGQIGQTTQLINGRIYNALQYRGSKEIPVRVLNNRAVLDDDRLFR